MQYATRTSTELIIKKNSMQLNARRLESANICAGGKYGENDIISVYF